MSVGEDLQTGKPSGGQGKATPDQMCAGGTHKPRQQRTGLVWLGAGQVMEMRLLGLRSRGRSTRLGNMDFILEVVREPPNSLSRE